MELEYYLVSELASKLGVTEKEIIHRGIRNELPIYVSRERLTSLNECSASIEKTIVEFNGDKTFHIPAGEEQMQFFERLSIQTLRDLDMANIYDLMETVRSHLTLFDIDKGNCREISAHSHDYNNPMIDLNCLYILNEDMPRPKESNHYAYISKLPDSIQIAIDVYDKFWADLPENMRKPPKAELENYIKSQIVNPDQTLIEAIIKISTPDDMRLGGKPETKRTEIWKLKKDR